MISLERRCSVFGKAGAVGLLACFLSITAHGFAYNAVTDSGELAVTGSAQPAVAWSAATVSFTNDITDNGLATDIANVQKEWSEVGANIAISAGDAVGTYCNHGDGVNMIVMDFSDCGESLGDILGITHISTRGVGQQQYIVDADILIKQFEPGSRTSWLPRAQVNANRRFSERSLCISQIDGSIQCDFYRVMLHEMGHGAGLAHPDEAGQAQYAVMNSGGSGLAKPFNLTDDDRAGLRFLYPSDGSGGGTSAPVVDDGDSGGGGGIAADLVPLLMVLLGLRRASGVSRFGRCG